MKKMKKYMKNIYGMLHFKSSDKYNQIKIYFEYLLYVAVLGTMMNKKRTR